MADGDAFYDYHVDKDEGDPCVIVQGMFYARGRCWKRGRQRGEWSQPRRFKEILTRLIRHGEIVEEANNSFTIRRDDSTGDLRMFISDEIYVISPAVAQILLDTPGVVRHD